MVHGRRLVDSAYGGAAADPLPLPLPATDEDCLAEEDGSVIVRDDLDALLQVGACRGRARSREGGRGRACDVGFRSTRDCTVLLLPHPPFRAALPAPCQPPAHPRCCRWTSASPLCATRSVPACWRLCSTWGAAPRRASWAKPAASSCARQRWAGGRG